MRRPDVFTLDYSHPLAQGLVLASMMRRGRDESLRNLHGAIVNIPNSSWYIDDIIGRHAVKFSGGGDYIDHPYKPSAIDFGSGGTLASWLMFGTASTNEYTGSWNAPRAFLGKLGGQPAFGWGDSTQYGPNVDVTAGLWYHFAISNNGSTSQIYINGVEIKSVVQSFSGTQVNNFGVGICIGVGRPMQGPVSDTVLYNRPLSPAEIAILADPTDPMLGGLVREVNPVAYFDMGGSGTPYSLAQDLLSSFSSIIGFSTDSVSSVSTDVDIVQDGKSVISKSFIVSQDSILRGSNIFVISQDGELSASNLFYNVQDSRTKSITLWSNSHDTEGKISSEWNRNQDFILSASTAIDNKQEGSTKIYEYLIQNFDGKSTFLTKMWMNHDCISKVSSDVNFIFDSKAVVSSVGSYSIEMDSLAKISEQKLTKQDAKLDSSFVYTVTQDSKSAISAIGYWSISCDSLTKVHTDIVLNEDLISKISSTLENYFDVQVASSSKIAIDQDINLIVKTALQISFDSEGKVAETYKEFQEAVAGISSGYAVIQDGMVHAIQVDFAQMAKLDLESFGLNVLSVGEESSVVKSLESKSAITIIKI